MQCKKHSQVIQFICSKQNCSQGNLQCHQCLQQNEVHKQEHKTYLFPIKEFLDLQNGSYFDQYIIKGRTKSHFVPQISELIVELDRRLIEYQKILDKELNDVDQDIAQIFKIFFETSEKAKNFMKDRLSKDYRDRQSQTQKLKLYLKDLSDQGSLKKKDSTFFQTLIGREDSDKELPISEQNILQIINKNGSYNQIRSDILFLLINVSTSIQKETPQNGQISRPRYKAFSTAQDQYEAIKQDFIQQLTYLYKQISDLLTEGNQTVDDLKRSVYKSNELYQSVVSLKLNDSTSIRQSQLIHGGSQKNLSLNNSSVSLKNSITQDKLSKVQSSPVFHSTKPYVSIQRFPEFPPIINNCLNVYGILPQPPIDSIIVNLERVGPIQFKDLTIYEGQMLDDQRHGWGRAVFNGSFYEGYWREGLPFGFGRVITSDGCVYEGMTINGKAQGKGVYYSSDRNYVYDGDWMLDQKEGKGYETVKGKYEYEGDFVQGLKHGQGKLKDLEIENIYNGEFKQGELKIQGQCSIEYSNQDKYWGEVIYKDSQIQRHGRGIYLWQDGRKYEGEYNFDREDGVGLFIWQLKKNDGWIYNGQWRNGVQHGTGVQINPQGKEKKCSWENGNFKSWL